MKTQITKFKVAVRNTYPYTHRGVQAMIRTILDTYGITSFDLAKRSGINSATIYQILKKSENEVTRPPRKSTVQALAKAIGADVSFNSEKNMLYLNSAPLPETTHSDIAQFLLQVADAVRQSGRTEIPREERDKILRVLKVMLA